MVIFLLLFIVLLIHVCVCVVQLSNLEEDLRQCKRERDEAVLNEKVLEQKVYDLEMEAETKAHSKDDKSRQLKLMEV